MFGYSVPLAIFWLLFSGNRVLVTIGVLVITTLAFLEKATKTIPSEFLLIRQNATTPPHFHLTVAETLSTSIATEAFVANDSPPSSTNDPKDDQGMYIATTVAMVLFLLTFGIIFVGGFWICFASLWRRYYWHRFWWKRIPGTHSQPPTRFSNINSNGNGNRVSRSGDSVA
ncbi:hypothetical protein F4777DRAFT_89696 [Nemania sp. FL0916]|nr:hypothetical protein F4777DRAFT_89696 [Nemania sp. FL0916]